MVASSSTSASLKEYLKRYENNNEEDKKKKKKKKKAKPDATGVVVVDEDPVWQKQVNFEEEKEESEDEEKPQVDEDIEVKRMKRLEQIKSRRPFGAISEDGSGWVSVSASENLNSNGRNSETNPFHPSGSDPNYQNSGDTDISPRRRRARYDTPSPEGDLKPSESIAEFTDLSPQRRRHKRHYTPSPEPEMKPSRSSGPDPDFSPPRRSRPQRLSEYEMKNSEERNLPDQSPPRRVPRSYPYQDDSRAYAGEDLSPQRKRRKERSGLRDASPRQSDRHSTEIDASHVSSVSDLSPPRKIQKESTILSGRPKTGLVTGLDIKEEIAKTKKEDWLRFKDMDPSMSGRGAEPVYRDKITGERMSKDQYSKKLEKREEKPKEIKLEWGKGLAQKREAEEKERELELEKDKPFARTRDDPELDKLLKERVRWGDPMAHLVKKKQSELVLPDLGDDEKVKESGFIIPQEIPSHSWLKRRLDAAPNRYGIKPGRHWDGVDRSNGFEKQSFKRMNDKQATEREAYLWSVSDM